MPRSANDSETQKENHIMQKLGSVCSGTLRLRDLIPSLCRAIGEIDSENPLMQSVLLRIYLSDGDQFDFEGEAYEGRSEYWDTDESEFDLDSLLHTLDVLAPPYCVFGASDVNSTDYGFWPDCRSIEAAVLSGDLPRFSACKDPSIAGDYDGHWISVGDAGQYTLLLRRDGIDREVWSA
jgi:hypothetical protein